MLDFEWAPLRSAVAGGRSALVCVLGAVLLAFVAGPSSIPAPTAPRPAPSAAQPIQNLRAFARLFGYVRYFHPSDAAAQVDWERFAMHGVRRVKTAATRAELRRRLRALFAPIAPTVQLFRTDASPPPPAAALTPPEVEERPIVAWQHEGVRLDNVTKLYRSIRLHRTVEDTATRRSMVQVAQVLDASAYRGKQVQLRAAVRTSRPSASVHLWVGLIQPDCRPSPKTLFDRPIASTDWTSRRRTRTVTADAERILIGATVRSTGTAWVDDMALFVRDTTRESSWTPVEIQNPGFEEGRGGGWNRYDRSDGTVSIVNGVAHSGTRSARLKMPALSQVGLFDARPSPGEVVTRPLGRGLSAQIPLALPSVDGHTVRPDGASSTDSLFAALDAVRVDSLTATTEALRLADVVLAWNVFRHFYPYFDVVDVDWDAVLSRTLLRARVDASPEAFLRTLRRMVAQLKDGHGRVTHPVDRATTGLPLRVDRIGGRVVVVDTVAYREGESCPRPGDVVVSVDGTPAAAELRAAKRVLSGSSQWSTYRALRRFGEGKAGTTAALVLRRDGHRVKCSVPRARDGEIKRWRRRLQTEPRPDSIDSLPGGFRYVDLTRIGQATLQRRVEEWARARGVVFDVRGYPTGGVQWLLRHLSPDTLRSARFEVPQRLRPAPAPVAGYATERWTLPPKTPQFEGRVVFLTDERTVSYAESILGIVAHYDLGAIVGQPTAGTNGNVNPFTLPGGYEVTWTGMRVRKHDGSQHHLVGIRPTIPVDRTLEGVREGRDEVLARAVEYLRRGDLRE